MKKAKPPRSASERHDYYVYNLVDPRTGETFYIGKGTGLRAEFHERQAVKGSHPNPRITQRVIAIRDSGQRPLIVRVAEGLCESDALDLERSEIASHKHLCNIAPGVASGYERMREAARAQIRRYKPFREWVAERPRTAGQVEMYWKLLKAIAREVAHPSPNVIAMNRDGTWSERWEPSR